MGDVVGSTRVIFAGVLLGALLGGCGGGGGGAVAPGVGTPRPSPSSSAVGTPTPTPAPAASPTPAATGSPNAGGTVGIGVPTPAPVLCSPSPVTVAVGQTTVVQCVAQGYSGPIGSLIANATIASVSPASGTYTFFYVEGLKAGTTTLSLSYPPGGTGSVSVIVSP